MTVEVLIAEQPTLQDLSIKLQFATFPEVCTPQVPLKGLYNHAGTFFFSICVSKQFGFVF